MAYYLAFLFGVIFGVVLVSLLTANGRDEESIGARLLSRTSKGDENEKDGGTT